MTWGEKHYFHQGSSHLMGEEKPSKDVVWDGVGGENSKVLN